MAETSRPPASRFVAGARRVYNPLGFSKGYNAILFLIWGGALMGFVLARLQYLSFYGVFCNEDNTGAAPGECYWYAMPRYHAGIMLHLASILPAGFLGVFQFVPAIRHRFIVYHKTAGYIILLLILIGVAGALMIARVSFGGGLDIQAMVGMLAIATIVSLSLAYYNIKRKQIDQHRAWMLRAWFYMGTIITMRLIMILAAMIVSTYPDGFYSVQSCAKLIYTENNNATKVYAKFPACAPAHLNMTVDGQVVVKANFNSLEGAMSALNISFGMAGWLAAILHAVGVEIYLRLTPREAERLRNVSYHRQLELGMKNPGSAGLVVEKFGDADPWVPAPAAETAPKSVVSSEVDDDMPSNR
jgi:uncharacterized membrane protein